MTLEIITSPFPSPPTFPSYNPHDVVFNDISPHYQQPFGNHVAYIDGITGKKWTRDEFRERSEGAARALYAERKDGGLGLGRKANYKDDIIGILSPNCMVFASSPRNTYDMLKRYKGIPNHSPRTNDPRCPVRTIPNIRIPTRTSSLHPSV